MRHSHLQRARHGWHYGQIANRCRVNSLTLGASTNWMLRTAHWSFGLGPDTRILWPTWRWDGSGNEVDTTSRTLSATLEYPAGTFRYLTWGGSTTATLPAGTNTFSDPIGFGVPPGVWFWLRMRHISGEFIYSSSGTSGMWASPALGDGLESTSTDKLTSGTVASSAGNQTHPLVIACRTRLRSVALFGDSRVAGQLDSVDDLAGCRGQLERPIGNQMPWINFALAGMAITPLLGSTGARSREIVKAYCSEAIDEFGINGTAETDLLASYEQLAELMRPRPLWQTTLCPWTFGAWTLADGSDQTINKHPEEPGYGINPPLRTGSVKGLRGVIDQYAAVANPSVINKWVGSATAGYALTTDGAHESSDCCINRYVINASPMRHSHLNGARRQGIVV
jgi:hypothetical protein